MQWFLGAVIAAIVAVLTVMVTVPHQQLTDNLAGYFRDVGWGGIASWIASHPSLIVIVFGFLCIVFLLLALFGWIRSVIYKRKHIQLIQELHAIFNSVMQLSSSAELVASPEQYEAWKTDVNALPGRIRNKLAGKLSQVEINIIVNGPRGPSLSFRGNFGAEQNNLHNFLHYLEHRVSQSIAKHS